MPVPRCSVPRAGWPVVSSLGRNGVLRIPEGPPSADRPGAECGLQNSPRGCYPLFGSQGKNLEQDRRRKGEIAAKACKAALGSVLESYAVTLRSAPECARRPQRVPRPPRCLIGGPGTTAGIRRPSSGPIPEALPCVSVRRPGASPLPAGPRSHRSRSRCGGSPGGPRPSCSTPRARALQVLPSRCSG